MSEAIRKESEVKSVGTFKLHRYMESKTNHNNPAWGENSPEKREDSLHLRLLDLLIKKTIKKLEEDSYEPKVQDALKAIQLKQALSETSDAEKTFWQLIDEIRSSELESLNSVQKRKESLEAQILRTIMGLKDQVKRGVLPVKTITDAFNQGFTLKGKSKESQLTYHRIGRILSAMGFNKARVGNNIGILWDQENIKRLMKIYDLPQPHESHASR